MTNVFALGNNIKRGNDSLLAGILFGSILGTAFLGVMMYSLVAKIRGETGAPPVRDYERHEIMEQEHAKLEAIVAMGGDAHTDVSEARAKLAQRKAAARAAAEDAAFATAAGTLAAKAAEIEKLRKQIEAMKAKAKAAKQKAERKGRKGESDGELRDSAEEAPRPRRGRGKSGSRIPDTEMGRSRRYEEEEEEEEEDDDSVEDRRRRRRRRPDYE